MKITKQRLKEIITEELDSIQEYDEGNIPHTTDDATDRSSIDAFWMQVRDPSKSALAAPEKMTTPGAQRMARERIGKFVFMMLSLNLSAEEGAFWRAVHEAIERSNI